MKKIEQTIDEVFGESWHLDWQELPDTCKAWLIEKNRACASGMPQEKSIDEVVGEPWYVDWSTILEKNWNQHRQTLTQLKDPKHTNIRRQKIEMLLWQNRVRTPEQREAEDYELDQALRAPARENGKLKKNKRYHELGIDLDNVSNIRPTSRSDYDWQIEERTRLNHAITNARAPLTAAKRKANELLGIYVEAEPVSTALPLGYADSVTKATHQHQIDQAKKDAPESVGQQIESGQKVAPRTKLDLQIAEIVQAVLSLNFELMRVPSGGKRRVKDICLKNRAAIGSVHVFDRAWQTASQTNKIKSSVSGS